VSGPETVLHDDTTAAAGDWITTRRNERRLRLPDGSHVRNGDTWQINHVHPDGSITATSRQDTDLSHRQIHLPADYVAEHVELGYASTVHRAQGATVDTAHVVTGPGMTRQALYVALTRGRQANHAWTVTDAPPETETHQHGLSLTGRQILGGILATDGAQTSATATLRRRQNEAGAPRNLHAVRETLAAQAATDPAAAAAVAEIDAILETRLAERSGSVTRTAPQNWAPRHGSISR
jgi:hypothetical protein